MLADRHSQCMYFSMSVGIFLDSQGTGTTMRRICPVWKHCGSLFAASCSIISISNGLYSARILAATVLASPSPG